MGRGGFGLRALADLENRVVDAERAAASLVGVVALDLLGHVDEAPGIDRVVASRLRDDAPADALALATRAEAELGLLGTAAAKRLSDLLEPT